MSKDPTNKAANPYIPKYISNRPWYRGTQDEGGDVDSLSHQRNTTEIIDFSEAKSGEGIHDDVEITETSRIKRAGDYDSKRDRWFGYQASDWDDILKNWDDIKSKKADIAEAEDSDDTDYELELVELGLSKEDLKNNTKEDDLERAVRDRQDIPSYLLNISSKNSKIKYDPKSRRAQNLSGIMNDSDQFVTSLNGDAASLTELQRFAWEENEKDQKERQRENFTKRLENLAKFQNTEDVDSMVNLDLNIEGNPTLMEYKLRKKRQDIQDSKQQKRQKILTFYGAEDDAEIKSDFEETNDKHPNSIPNAVNDQSAIAEVKSARSHKRQNSKTSTDKSPGASNGSRVTPTPTTTGSIDLVTRATNHSEHYSGTESSTPHTTAFGSYYSDGKWGYKCCSQTERNSKCKRSQK